MANNTRNSIVKNPAAWRGSEHFGVKEFRKYGFATEDTKDRIAERQITAGYSKKRNPVCPTCNIQMPATKVCSTCN
jgi:hypothetical protein